MVVAETSHNLPGLLAEIAKAAGLDAAMKVAEAKGGVQAYFPARPKASHWLTKCVGPDKAQAIAAQLCSGHGGIELLVPMGPDKSKIAKWRKMRDMIEQGFSKRQIARTCRVHERTVQNHRNNKAVTVTAALAQMDMFD